MRLRGAESTLERTTWARPFIHRPSRVTLWTSANFLDRSSALPAGHFFGHSIVVLVVRVGRFWPRLAQHAVSCAVDEFLVERHRPASDRARMKLARGFPQHHQRSRLLIGLLGEHPVLERAASADQSARRRFREVIGYPLCGSYRVRTFREHLFVIALATDLTR